MHLCRYLFVTAVLLPVGHAIFGMKKKGQNKEEEEANSYSQLAKVRACLSMTVTSRGSIDGMRIWSKILPIPRATRVKDEETLARRMRSRAPRRPVRWPAHHVSEMARALSVSETTARRL